MTHISSYEAVESVNKVLKIATSYANIFGYVPGVTQNERLRKLKQEYRKIVRFVHPDTVPDKDKAFASDVFIEVQKMWNRAEGALKNGSYDKTFTSLETSFDENLGMTIVSDKETYIVDNEVFEEGDFSLIYKAVHKGKNNCLLLKISSDPINNTWLEKEVKILHRFTSTVKGTAECGIKNFIPKILDVFTVSDELNRRFRVTAMQYADGYFSVEHILKMRPNLDYRDGAWIARRVIAQSLAASVVGVVHCGITPDHVLVNGITHEPMHIGWTHCIEDVGRGYSRITHIVPKWEAWYPPEVFEKKPVTHKVDIYMLGKTLMALFGGNPENNSMPKNVPISITRLIFACVEESPELRPNGKQLLDAFTRAVRNEWGTKYRSLKL